MQLSAFRLIFVQHDHSPTSILPSIWTKRIAIVKYKISIKRHTSQAVGLVGIVPL